MVYDNLNDKEMKVLKLSNLPNIGKTLESELESVGINTPDDLREIGSIDAIIRLNVDGDTCYNKLYALEGAIQNVRWHSLSEEVRSSLRDKYKKTMK